jgi:hypothetical protein
MINFILCAFGLTQILCFGKIFDKIRPNYKFFHCPMCVGFWVGMFLWFISPFTTLFTFDRSLITCFLLGCLSSGMSYVISMMFGDEGLNINVSKTK